MTEAKVCGADHFVSVVPVTKSFVPVSVKVSWLVASLAAGEPSL